MAWFMDVRGGHGGPIAGALGPEGLDARLEWVDVPERRGLLDTVVARLGSEADPEKILLAVLCPLRSALRGPALEAILAALPLGLAGEIRDGERFLLRPAAAPADAVAYLAEVALRARHPAAQAKAYVLAVLGAMRETLPPEAAARVAAALPPGLARWWDAAA